MEEPNSLKAERIANLPPSGGFAIYGGRKMIARLKIPAKNGVRHHDNDNYKKLGTVRPLDKNDPRNIDHPSHKEKWLVLMRELGRITAARDWEHQHGDGE